MKAKISIFLSIILLCFTLHLPSTVRAQDSFSLNQTKLTLQVGNTYNLYLSDSSTSDDFYPYYYPCNWSTSNPEVAVVQDGYVTIVGKGKAIITAELNGKKYTCTITAKASSYRCSLTSLTTKTFQEEHMHLTHNDNVQYYEHEIYQIADDQSESKAYDVMNLWIDDTGNITMTPRKSGIYHIYFYAYAYDEATDQSQRYSASSCTVTVTTHGLEETSIGCALSTKRRLTYGDLSQINFQITDPQIASVSQNGLIIPIVAGTTELTMTGYNDLGELETYNCELSVTDPQVTLSSPYVKPDYRVDFTITGDSGYESYIYSSANQNVIGCNESGLYGIKEGSTKISVTVDGRKFVFPIDVVNPRLNKDSFILYPSATANISILGLSSSLKKEKVTYSLDNTKVASVSKNGKITGKAVGNTILTIQIGDFSLQAGISVGNKKAVQAVNNALSVVGSAYSQERRMQKGYYDCSSLAWRSYSPLGITLGNASYAPTAADIGKYLYTNKKGIAKTYVDPLKLQPGDLIFYGGGNNGRFRNIYHVAMFTGIGPGYSYDDFWESMFGYDNSYSSSSATGYIVHAASGGVHSSTYTSTYGEIVLIARPTK